MLNSGPKADEAKLSEAEILQFQNALVSWFARHKRDLPWRRTKDPYAIWISEIMLQQTRVAAVIPFYERFLSRFPDFRALATASESALLAHWAGLGYYSRARNLQKAARTMCERDFFPREYNEIQALPGVGDYTSAAIASIAFALPFPVLDGNVLRVLSRLQADGCDVGSNAGRKHFRPLADKLLARAQPGTFNQAMMELGATVCLPKNPQCLVCPVGQFCRARQTGRQNEFPVKLRRPKGVFKERVVFWIVREGQILLWQRPATARLMPGFWELPEKTQLPAVEAGRVLGTFRHGITFHNYRFEVREANLPNELGECRWVKIEDLESLPLSTVVRKAERSVKKLTQRAVAAM